MTASDKVTFSSRVAWSDTDAGGVVYYGTYCRWVEYAEAELWRRAGIPLADLFDRHEMWLPRIDFTCRFRRPLLYDDPFEVQIRIKRWSRVAITYAFEVIRSDPGDVAARGELRVAAVDKTSFTAREFPDEARESLLGAGLLPGDARGSASD